jgi:hypothetical protein
MIKRLAGAVWLTTWVIVLRLVSKPWSDLGGLVSERLRWLEWFVLGMGLIIGYSIGGFGRDACHRESGRCHAGLLRYLLYPVGLSAALALVGLKVAGLHDGIGIVLTAVLAYWAGFDLAFGALPLLAGKSYRFSESLDVDPLISVSARQDDRSGYAP